MEIRVLVEDLYDEENGDDFVVKHPGDAGIDLRLSGDCEIPPGTTLKVGLGLAVKLPRGTVGWLTSRSSAALESGLVIHEGKIDEGYRGEVHAVLSNPHSFAISIARGTKVCQLLVLPIFEPNWILVDDFTDETSRGADGFGSTT